MERAELQQHSHPHIKVRYNYLCCQVRTSLLRLKVEDARVELEQGPVGATAMSAIVKEGTDAVKAKLLAFVVIGDSSKATCLLYTSPSPRD